MKTSSLFVSGPVGSKSISDRASSVLCLGFWCCRLISTTWTSPQVTTLPAYSLLLYLHYASISSPEHSASRQKRPISSSYPSTWSSWNTDCFPVILPPLSFYRTLPSSSRSFVSGASSNAFWLFVFPPLLPRVSSWRLLSVQDFHGYYFISLMKHHSSKPWFWSISLRRWAGLTCQCTCCNGFAHTF